MSFGSSEDEYAKEIGLDGGDDDTRLVVGRVVPAPFSDDVNPASRKMVKESDVRKLPGGSYMEDHPSPHAAHDKTEEWDMRKGREKWAAQREEAEKRQTILDGSAPLGVEDAARVDSQGQPYNAVSKDSRTMAERAADSVKAQIEQDIVERLGQGAGGGGIRLNAGKNRIELLPPEWLWALADVMTQGSKKYDARNWEKGMDWSAMIGCMYRHVAKFQAGQRFDGEKFDKELGTTGCHELAMVAWNALALMVYDIRNIGTNDLPVLDQLDLFDDVNAATSNLETRWEHDRITPPEPGDAP